jgi:hypothetical protein
VPIARSEELRATLTGQVATSLQGKDVFSLNLKRYYAAKLNRPALSLEKTCEFRKGRPEHTYLRHGPRNGYRIEKLTYESELGIMIPALLLRAQNGDRQVPSRLICRRRGQEGFRRRRGAVASQGVHRDDGAPARDGPDPLALDSHGDPIRYFRDHDSAETAILPGKTLAGMRAADLSRAVDLLAAGPDVDTSKLSGFGKGAAEVAMLHAAALGPRFQKLALEDMLMSCDAIVTHRIHRRRSNRLFRQHSSFTIFRIWQARSRRVRSGYRCGEWAR